MEVDRPDIRDVFLCHAREDKAAVAEPLYAALTARGIKCWYDRAELQWGDSIPEKVGEGLRISRFVLVVLSRTFLTKPWALRELHAAMNIEASRGTVKVLPLLCGSEAERASILARLPLLNDKLFLVWSGSAAETAEALLARLQQSSSPLTVSPLSEPEGTRPRANEGSWVLRSSEDMQRVGRWFIALGLGTVFAIPVFVLVLPPVAPLWGAFAMCIVCAGISLEMAARDYQKAHYRFPQLAAIEPPGSNVFPFTSAWWGTWRASEQFPELRRGLISVSAAYGFALLSILLGAGMAAVF